MPTNLWCSNKFISTGESIIELADINIRTIQIVDNEEIKDRTDFLKHGNAYETLQKINNIQLNTINDEISIQIDENNLYYFDNNTGITIDIYDKLVIYGNNSDDTIYCSVTDVKDNRIFFIYYTKQSILLNSTIYTKLQHIKYLDIEEYAVTYDIMIDSTDNDEYIFPIFLPDMKQTLSSKKNILIHVNNEIEKMSFILLSKNNFNINNLTLNSPYIFEYSKNSNNFGIYTTFTLCLLYNGDKSWFIV